MYLIESIETDYQRNASDIDVVVLKNGKVITVDEESIVVHKSLRDYKDGNPPIWFEFFAKMI